MVLGFIALDGLSKKRPVPQRPHCVFEEPWTTEHGALDTQEGM